MANRAGSVIWENTSSDHGVGIQERIPLSGAGVGFAERFKWKVTLQPGWERTFSSGVEESKSFGFAGLWEQLSQSVVAVRMPWRGGM